MNDRDELTGILHRRIGGSVGETVGDILAAGYRKPRTITTIEELKTVYEGAVLVDPSGDVWSIDGSTGRVFSISDGSSETYDDDELPLPAVVVYEGDES